MENIVDFKDLRVIGYKARINKRTIEELTSEDFKDFLTFTDRENYLKWAADWKSDYADISEYIRQIKSKTKELQKANDEDASTAQSQLSEMKFRARLAISLRRASKSYSWSLRALAREARERIANP